MELGIAGPYEEGSVLSVCFDDAGLSDVVVLDQSRKVLKHVSGVEVTPELIVELVKEHNIKVLLWPDYLKKEEVETAWRKALKQADLRLEWYCVDAPEASLFSESAAAKKQYPDAGANQLKAIYMARKMMDPLGELIQFKPSQLKVGPYQAEVDSQLLDHRLSKVMERQVLGRGIAINQASLAELCFLPGVDERVAEGLFQAVQGQPVKSKEDLKERLPLSESAYDQLIGFIVLPAAENILDRTLIHPREYSALTEYVKGQNVALEDVVFDPDKLFKNKDAAANSLVKRWHDELKRRPLKKGSFRSARGFNCFRPLFFDIEKQAISSLKENQVLRGRIHSVSPFGVFVHVGLKTKGLVHLSTFSESDKAQVSKRFRPGSVIQVKVVSFDEANKKITLEYLPEKKIPKRRPVGPSKKRPAAPSKDTRKPKKNFGTLGDQFSGLFSNKS